MAGADRLTEISAAADPPPASPPPAPSGTGKALAGLFALSAVLRLPRINQGLGYDEIYSVRNFFLAPVSVILRDMHVPNNHPLYSLLAHFAVQVLGPHEWSVHLPAFLAGCLTPPLLYLLGRRLFGPRVGLLAGLLFAVAFWPLWQSNDARGYSLMMFFSLLAVLLFLGLRGQFSAGRAAGFFLAAVAGAYSHLYGGFVIIGCVAAALLPPGGRRDRLRLVAVALAAGTVAAALYLPYLPDLIAFAPSGRNMHAHGNRVSPALLAQVLLDWPLGPGRRLWSAPLWALAAAGLVPAWRKARDWLAAWAAALAAGIIVPLAASSFAFPRFYHYSLPGFFLLAAAGADALREKLDRANNGLGALVPAAAVAIVLTGTVFYFRLDQYPTRTVAQWVTANASGRRAMTLGQNCEIMDFYLPGVILMPDEPIKSGWLPGAAVIVRDPQSLSAHDAGILTDFCRPPVVFPSSSGETEFENRVYLCD